LRDESAGILSQVTGIHGFEHSTGFVVARNLAIVFAVVFWLGLAFWVRRDARRRSSDGFLVFMAGALGLVPYLGPIVYLLLRPGETLAEAHSRRVELQALEQQLRRARPSCPLCSSPVEADYLACPVCTTRVRQPCAKCNAPLEPLWQMCPYCTAPIELTQADLDAALTAEAALITRVGGRFPAPLHAASPAGD
jgi:hypothetical protein